jgi:sugar lactone lactonase YvrE
MRPLMQARLWLSPLFLSLALGLIAMPAKAQVASTDQPVGTIVNFGPNLQTTAGGVCRQPEGIAVDTDGNFYLASNSDAVQTVGHVCVLDSKGNLIDIINVPQGPGATAIGLIGELWEGDSLYVLDQADDFAPHGRILKINPKTHAVTTVASGITFPNCIVEDRHGNFYVADSFESRIYKFSADNPNLTVWFESNLFTSTNANQPVGTNDLAFDLDEDTLYVSDAGNRQVFKIQVDNQGNPGAMTLFADGASLDTQYGLPVPTALFFADGMQIDVKGNLYVMSNLTNEFEVFARDGKLVNRYSGTGANALDFNASPIFKGSKLYMTNMSATDGGVGSKVSVLQAPYPGIRLQ